MTALRRHLARMLTTGFLLGGLMSALTLPVTPVAASTAPNTPVVSLVSATGNSIRVGWTAPATNGLPITRYELRRGATLVSSSITASTLAYTNSGLSSGTEYSFTVKACSTGGCSEASTPLVASTLPAAALNVAGAAGEGSVTVTWTDSPSLSLTGHKVFYRLLADVAWTEWTPGEIDATPTVVTGLTNAASYVFKVAAFNNSGATDSKVSRTVIPRTVPNAPVISTSTISGVGVGLTWVAPAGNGAAVSSYKIYRDGVQIGTNGTSTRYTASGLTAGTQYAFHVEACNVAGCSAQSNTLNLATKPAATTSITAEPGDTTLTVSWTASVSPVVNGYRLWYKTSSASTWTEWTPGTFDSSPVTVTGLTNGTAYVFKLASVNDSGLVESRNSPSFTPRTLPGVPVVSVTAVTSGSIAIAWPAPDTGGNKITGYQVYVDGVLTQTVTSAKASLLSLSSATSYAIRVKACNASGCSNLSTLVTQATKPLAVTPVATRSDGEVTVTWNSASGTITRYDLYYKVATSPTWILWTPGIGDTSPTTVTGLTNGVAYNFKVNTINSAADIESRSASATPIGVPPLAPAQPGAASITATGAAISWVIPSNTGGISANGFQIWVNGLLTATTPSSARAYNLTGLTPGDTATVQVKVCNTAGCSPASTTRNVTTLPIPVTGVSTDPAARSVSISWSNPNGTAVSATNVFFKIATSATWTEWTTGTSDTSPTSITGLTPGMSYQFKIQTVASSGTVETAASSTTTLYAVPGAPTNLLTTPGNQTVSLSWTAPADDGGTAITDYLIEVNSGSGWSTFTDGTSSATSATVTGLENGTEYNFRVSAINAAGTGDPSDTGLASGTTPRTVPGVVGTLGSTYGNQTVTLTWTAPANDGGAPIESYRIEYHDGDGAWDLHGNPASASVVIDGSASYVVTGLSNGTTYSFRVSAVNVAGTGTTGTAITAQPRTTPSQPRNIAATAGQSTATVSWDAPADNGGVPITGYLVEYHDGDGLWVATSTASGTATTITGLSTGITYSFRVSAENSEGYGAFSGTSTAATYTVPDAPTGVSATAGNAQLAVTWTAPASNGGATITDYLVEYNSGSGWATFTDGVSTSTTATITGLTNGTAYQVRVSAINVAGTGTGSNASAARTPRTVATAPINFTATPGNGQVELSWTAPASDGGAAITDYFVYYLVNPSTVLSVSSAGATSYTVTGLTNGGSYDFRVHAVNAAGAGAQAYSATVIPRTVPDAPTNLQATAGNQTTALTWTAPADTGGVAITDYLVEINSGSGWQTFADGVSTSTSATVTGLSNGTSHTFRVSAINVAGTGSASSTATATPYTVPGAPVITSSSSDASSVAVYFTAPASNGGNAITGYQVACSSSNGGTSRSSTGSGSPITVSSLSEGKNYSCLVAATNAAGYGANSNAVALAAFQVDPDDYAATANYAEAVGSYAATANTTATLVGGDCSFGYGDIALVAQAGYAGHVWGCEEHQWVGWPIDVGGWGSYCETGEFYRGNGGCYLWNVVYAGTPAYSYSTSYSCPSGGDLSGTNCFYTYSYIASYSCPSGGSLSGSTCIRPAYWAGWNRTVT